MSDRTSLRVVVRSPVFEGVCVSARRECGRLGRLSTSSPGLCERSTKSLPRHAYTACRGRGRRKCCEDACNSLSRHASVVRCEARLRASKRSVSEGPSSGLPTVRRSPTFGRASVSTVMAVTWLILPVVICLSQRLSHACLSMNASHCETANGSLNQL